MRGTNLATLERFDEALTCHRHSLTCDEVQVDEAYLNIGYILRAQRQYDTAREAFAKALEITPDYPEAKEGLRTLEGIGEAIKLASDLP